MWLGHRFNQSIADVDWPASLKQLRFGHDFNQDVRRVRWPAGLEVSTMTAGKDDKWGGDQMEWVALEDCGVGCDSVVAH